jgi:hypothetical protein
MFQPTRIISALMEMYALSIILELWNYLLIRGLERCNSQIHSVFKSILCTICADGHNTHKNCMCLNYTRITYQENKPNLVLRHTKVNKNKYLLLFPFHILTVNVKADF